MIRVRLLLGLLLTNKLRIFIVLLLVTHMMLLSVSYCASFLIRIAVLLVVVRGVSLRKVKLRDHHDLTFGSVRVTLIGLVKEISHTSVVVVVSLVVFKFRFLDSF
jgi:hypothetical protein